MLVLSFLADEAKHVISRRVTSGSEAEEVLVGELVAVSLRDHYQDGA